MMNRRTLLIVGAGIVLVAAAIVWFAIAVTRQGDGPDDWRGLTMAIMAAAGFFLIVRGIRTRLP